MSDSLVLTVLGADRPGLVGTLSEIILAHDGVWVESHFANPAGLFAGIVHATVPAAKQEALEGALKVKELAGLEINFQRGIDAAEAMPGSRVVLDLVGQDRPGIVHQITAALAELEVNVDELHAETVQASMSGEQLFKAAIHIRIPPQVTVDQVQDALEDIANELMVDIDLSEQADHN